MNRTIELPEDLWFALAHKAVDLDVTPADLANEILKFMLRPPLAGGAPPPRDTDERTWVRSNHSDSAQGITLDCALSKNIRALLPVATVSAQSTIR
jgi:hypothetical protein